MTVVLRQWEFTIAFAQVLSFSFIETWRDAYSSGRGHQTTGEYRLPARGLEMGPINVRPEA